MQHEQNNDKIFSILEKVLFLKDIELFRNVDTERLGVIAEIAREIVYNDGEIIAREGDISDSLYIIKKGALKIFKEKDGQSYHLTNIKEGEAYGMYGVLGRNRRTAGAQAIGKTTLLEIRKNEFKKVLLSNPEIAYNMLEILTERIRTMDDEMVLMNRTLNRNLQNELAEIKTNK